MRGRFRFTVIAIAVLAVAAPAFLLADGTQLGTISGRVLDEQGGGIPGVTVELVSSDKGFRRTQTTDSSGSFTFAALQPGPYTVRAGLSGFTTIEKTNNIAAPDKVTDANLTMSLAATEEEVTVIGEVPLVDKSNTSATTTVSTTLTQKLAIGRSYQTLIQSAPGVTGGSNPNSHGALSSNNQYLFDGVDTTDVTTGTFGQNFNYEAIEEVVVSTAGISAEMAVPQRDRQRHQQVGDEHLLRLGQVHRHQRQLGRGQQGNQSRSTAIRSTARSSTRTSRAGRSRWVAHSGRITSGSSARTSFTTRPRLSVRHAPRRRPVTAP